MFETRHLPVNGFEMAHWHERCGRPGAPVVVCVHGWPETKLLYSRVVAPLLDAGFDVVVPDLRGFGESGLAPDGLYDIVSHARDIHALVHDGLGAREVILVGGDLGGPVVQEAALRWPGWVSRMVVFNSPLPYDKERMKGMVTRADPSTADYFMRQGTDADALIAELDTPGKRIAYVEQFYGPRLWAHPGAFTAEQARMHAEPFADAAKLRASFGNYESAFDSAKRSERPLFGRNSVTPTLVYFGTSDRVIYPDFDRMAEVVFDVIDGPHRLDGVGHFVPWEAPDVLVAGITRFCAGPV
ncbi:MAG: alpha/beta hydrolase [Actinobacteria bacterium]|nr:alpha/beta hydrolase [Actinomycetota bacterium]